MEHTHRWRATSKVFALVCECGTVYHDWLLLEIEKLKAAATTLPAPPAPPEDVTALRVQLEEARREAAALREQLDEARRELEARAEEVTSQLAGA